MDTEQHNTKKKVEQNQEDAISHLIKAVGKIEESNEKVSNEYTEEVRLEVEGEANGKTESIEKLDNRLEHLEQNIKQLAENQVKMIEEFQKQNQQASTTNVEEDTDEEEDSNKDSSRLECAVCGKVMSSKGFPRHVKTQHDIDIREMFEDGEFYKAEGLKSREFGNLAQNLNKKPNCRNITQIVEQRLKEEYQEGEESSTDKYACKICGDIYEDKRGLAGHLSASHGLSGNGVVEKNVRKPKTHELNQDERKTADRDEDWECIHCGRMISKSSVSRHLSSQHEDEIGLRDFYWDEQKEAYCFREQGVEEEEEWQKFLNKWQKFEFNCTDIFLDALQNDFNSEQEMYEKRNDSTEESDSEEEVDDNISDYERAKRKASVSDRDMEIAEQAIHKIIYDHLDNIPDSNEKFISYTGNENIPGFETLYAGDLGALNMWRKIFSNTGLLTGINERAAENHDLSWERKGSTGVPKNWVIKVERTDR